MRKWGIWGIWGRNIKKAIKEEDIWGNEKDKNMRKKSDKED